MIITNWATSTSKSTAEGALAMTLALLRNYHNMPYWMRRDGLYWETPGPGDEGLFEQRVGLHGLGAIAQEYVKLIAPFDCKVSAYSPHCPDSVFDQLGVARSDSLEDLYGSNRIISCHAAKRPDTYHLVGAQLLSLIEDGGCFVNTGRGAVVDEVALVAELEKGRIRAALDVYEEEPLPAEHPLRFLDNCMIVPHRAGPTPDRRKDMGRQAVDNIIAYAEGKPLDGVLNVKKYDLMT
ncbi:MAG: NAD(P)-dependent oxidoreductase [Planctomycetota bacterium]|jgi:phosphoglycerate dehydrogenase-like enzyme